MCNPGALCGLLLNMISGPRPNGSMCPRASSLYSHQQWRQKWAGCPGWSLQSSRKASDGCSLAKARGWTRCRESVLGTPSVTLHYTCASSSPVHAKPCQQRNACSFDSRSLSVELPVVWASYFLTLVERLLQMPVAEPENPARLLRLLFYFTIVPRKAKTKWEASEG